MDQVGNGGLAAAWQRLWVAAHTCANAARPLAMIQHSTIFLARSKSRSARITSSLCSRSPEQKLLTAVQFAVANSANSRTGISESIRNRFRSARALSSTLRFITCTRRIRLFVFYARPPPSAPTSGAREYRQQPFGDVATGLMFDNPAGTPCITAQARRHNHCRTSLRLVG
jgi:hypothetical protein